MLWVMLPVFYGSPPRRCVRCGQSHTGVCGVCGRRRNNRCGEYKRGQPPAFGRAGNITNAGLQVVLLQAVVSRVSVAPTPVRGLQPPHSVQVRSSPFKSVRGAHSRNGGWQSRQRAPPQVELPQAVVSRVSVGQASVRGLRPPHSVQVRSSPFGALIRATAACNRAGVSPSQIRLAAQSKPPAELVVCTSPIRAYYRQVLLGL